MINDIQDKKDLLKRFNEQQNDILSDPRYAIDITTGKVKFLINVIDIYNTIDKKQASTNISNLKQYKAKIKQYLDKEYNNTSNDIQKDIMQFNTDFRAFYLMTANTIINCYQESNKIEIANIYADALSIIIQDKYNSVGYDSFITLDYIDSLQQKDLEDIQKALKQRKKITNIKDICYKIIYKNCIDHLNKCIQDNESYYISLDKLITDIHKKIYKIVDIFTNKSNAINSITDTHTLTRVNLPPNTTFNFDIMKLFNNIYPNYKFKSIDEDRHKRYDIKSKLMLDIDVSSMEDIRLIDFIKSGNIQLYPIQSALINNFIKIRDYNNTMDKVIPLLSVLKQSTEDKQMRLPTSKKDLNLYDDFMLFFNKCKIQINIIDRDTNKSVFEILEPIPLLSNTPAVKEGKYGYIIGNSILNILKNELDNLNETPRETTHLTDKQYLNAPIPKTAPYINMVNYIQPKIAQMINSYNKRNTYNSKIDITCLYDFQALYKKQLKANKNDKNDVREMLNKYLDYLIKKGLIKSYKPIIKGKEINAYQIIINQNAKI